MLSGYSSFDVDPRNVLGMFIQADGSVAAATRRDKSAAWIEPDLFRMLTSRPLLCVPCTISHHTAPQFLSINHRARIANFVTPPRIAV
jgi:hypothetical protein